MIVLFMCHSVSASLVMSCSWYCLAACWWFPPWNVYFGKVMFAFRNF